jgi:polar amino acid transport system permease protein
MQKARQASMAQSPPPSDRKSPTGLDKGAFLRRLSQIGQALAALGLIFWLIWAGIMQLDYRWQWFRVEPFFYRVVDGELIWGPLVRGLIMTLKIAGIAGVLAVLIGFLTALVRMSGSIAGRAIATVYLEAIRNTPLLVQLFLVYFVLAPIIGIDRFWAGVLCLAFFEGSFAAEIIRGGIRGVDRGQVEAARAVGLTRVDSYRYIIVPQALPLILPPLTGLMISTIKHSAIVSVIALAELTTQALNLISNTFMAFEIWFITAAIYLSLTVTLSFAVTLFEWRLTKPRR